MTTTTAIDQTTEVESFGKIAIRVVVLPKKDKGGKAATREGEQPLDLEPDEILPDQGTTTLGSYLETSKGGKQCCVFLVNGQRQDAMDNSLIIQQMGFKYLRNRMMIIVDVDDLEPEALGKLMQGSRQTLYRGGIWGAMLKRIVATLKEDPDLLRLEEEAEEQVSELEAGDEKVKQTLDQLIDSHHEHGMHFSEGIGAQGLDDSDENLGVKTVTTDGVVSLLPPEEGTPAEYPVLVSQPAAIRLLPNVRRDVSIKSMPSNAWPALAELTIDGDGTVPELLVAQERLSNYTKLTLHFREPDEFDTNQYPIRATLIATARFNGVQEPRRLELKVLVKPNTPPPPPVLEDPPTWLRVSSREPIKIKSEGADTHVRLRWNGKDELASGANRTWTFRARLLNREGQQPTMNFSEPSGGRLSLLVSPLPEWGVGEKLNFEVVASGPSGEVLSAAFEAEVSEPDEPPAEKEPRLVEAEIQKGANRRPPYVLKYVSQDDYEEIDCWGGENWTNDDPGCFTEPTDRLPLILFINKDMAALREYRRYLTKKFMESEVERRINKYTSHVAFHLYQMYQATKRQGNDAETTDQTQRTEIQRVSMTLIKLMEVSR